MSLSNQRARGESFIIGPKIAISQLTLRPEGGRGSARLSVSLMIWSFSVSFSWKMTLSDANSSARMVSEHFPGLSDVFNAGLTVFNRV